MCCNSVIVRTWVYPHLCIGVNVMKYGDKVLAGTSAKKTTSIDVTKKLIVVECCTKVNANSVPIFNQITFDYNNMSEMELLEYVADSVTIKQQNIDRKSGVIPATNVVKLPFPTRAKSTTKLGTREHAEKAFNALDDAAKLEIAALFAKRD